MFHENGIFRIRTFFIFKLNNYGHWTGTIQEGWKVKGAITLQSDSSIQFVITSLDLSFWCVSLHTEVNVFET